jgi:hypothetical protein
MILLTQLVLNCNKIYCHNKVYIAVVYTMNPYYVTFGICLHVHSMCVVQTTTIWIGNHISPSHPYTVTLNRLKRFLQSNSFVLWLLFWYNNHSQTVLLKISSGNNSNSQIIMSRFTIEEIWHLGRVQTNPFKTYTSSQSLCSCIFVWRYKGM